MFEYIYFARPDSVIDGHSVHEARVRAGEFLAMEHPVGADVVSACPTRGLTRRCYARQSGIPFGIGFIKNKYIGRTFIAPEKSREDMVRIKLNPICNVVCGKRVVLIDDSIVRGTTSARIVNLLREAGALEVHMRIASPPYLNPCYYGTDIGSRKYLIACRHTTDEIAKIIRVNSLGYLSLESVKRLIPWADCCGCCTACFDGYYPTAVPTENRKFRFEEKIPEREDEGAKGEQK